MSKLFLTGRIPHEYNRQVFMDILRQIEVQVNSLSEGRISSNYNAYSDSPDSGSHQRGDFVKNSNIVELGDAPNKYIIYGWICTSSGTPGTWRECRFTIGNDVISPSHGSITFTGYAPTVS